MEAHTRIRNGRVESVGLEMVPSFVLATDREITIEDLGSIPVHLVCVGGFFAMVSAPAVGIDLVPQNSRRLIRLGMAIIDAANRTLRVFHPERPEVRTVDAVEFYDEDPQTGMGRGLVIYGESHMDRSPCGTGTAAKLTLLHHRGKLAVGDCYQNSSPLETSFSGRIVSTRPIGDFEGIVARVRGTAQITGLHQFVVDSADPFPTGFIV